MRRIPGPGDLRIHLRHCSVSPCFAPEHRVGRHPLTLRPYPHPADNAPTQRWNSLFDGFRAYTARKWSHTEGI